MTKLPTLSSNLSLLGLSWEDLEKFAINEGEKVVSVTALSINDNEDEEVSNDSDNLVNDYDNNEINHDSENSVTQDNIKKENIEEDNND